MRVAEARVVERRALGPDRTLLWLSAPEISRAARPGQFVMVHPTGSFDPFLPRAFWVHRVRDGEDGDEFALLVKVAGEGTRLLAGAVPGGRLRVTGPLGRGLTLAPGVRSLLLVGVGIAVAPLVWCADEEVHRGRAVTLLIGGHDRGDVYPLELLRPEVEVSVATPDAPDGIRGVLDLLPEYAGWADQVVLSGGESLYRPAAETLRGLLWRRPCQVLVEAPVVCGTGICGGCGITARRGGSRLLCRDGPAFELRDLV